MPSQPSHGDAANQATNSGIVTDEKSGQRHIPESLRADGSTRKAIKIKPGYRETNLRALLEQRSITELVVVGSMSHMCIDGVVRAASEEMVRVSLSNITL